MNIVESDFFHAGLRCVTTRILPYDGGSSYYYDTVGISHRCGYVGVRPTHALHSVNYNQPILCPSHDLATRLEDALIDEIGILNAFCLSLAPEDERVRPSTVLYVHGGLTFSDSGAYPIPSIADLWWFGFDCGHYDDDYEEFLDNNWLRTGKPLSYVRGQTKYLAEQLAELFPAP